MMSTSAFLPPTASTGASGLAIGLVHNRNNERNQYLFPEVATLIATLSSTRPVIRLEASEQPPVEPHGLWMALARDYAYFAQDRAWSRYRGLKIKSGVRALRVFIKNSLKKYAPPREAAKRWMRNSHIETIVSDKHIRVWQQFLESGLSYLLVFEDDVVFRETSARSLRELLERLDQLPAQQQVYVDLAGGCRLEDLAISKLESGRDERFRYYIRPTTNTACAYLINRELTGLFMRTLIRRPWVRLMGVDWMMNKLFMLNKPADGQIFCAHADPTMFKHGSTTGDYVTWQA